MKRFLVYSGSGIGDIYINLPLARALCTRFPNCEVDLLVRSDCNSVRLLEDLISILPYYNRIFYYNNKEIYHSILTIGSLLRRHYELGFIGNYVVGADNSPWPSRIMRLARIKTVGIKSPGSNKTCYRWNIEYRPREHKKRTAVRLLAPLQIEPEEEFFSPLDKTLYSALINKDVLPNQDYIAVAPGCGPVPYIARGEKRTSSNKEWGYDRWLELIGLLIKRDYFVVILGGKKEKEELRHFKINDNHIINLSGKLSISQSVGAVACSSLFISADTGLMHCAAAMSIPTISIFGCTDYMEYAPCGETTRVVSSELDCSPCFGTAKSVTCEERLCMRSIPAYRVFEKCIELLDSVNKG